VRTEGQTDMTNLIVAFRNSANAPKNKRLLFTNECTSDCLKNNIKIYIENSSAMFRFTAPKHVGAIFNVNFNTLRTGDADLRF